MATAPASPTSSAAATLEPGAVVAGYRIDGVLRQRAGAYTLYAATRAEAQRPVALKLLAPRPDHDPDGFRAAAKRRAALRHLHLADVLEAGESEHGLFLATALVDARSLHSLLAAREVEPATAVRLLTQAASALDTANGAGVLHLDLEPETILVAQRRRGGALLTDFGVGTPTGRSLTESGELHGPADYLSPEQIRGVELSPSSNVYSLACILFECLTGTPPYAGRPDAGVLYAHLLDPVPPVTSRRSELGAGLDNVLAAGLAKDPAERQPSPGQLMKDAARALHSEPRRVPRRRPRPATGAPPAKRRQRRPGASVVALAVVGVLAAAVGGGFLLGRALSGEEVVKTVPTGDAGRAGNEARRGAAEADYVRRLNRVLAPLRSERTAGRRRLAEVRTARGQTAAATRLARAYERAARAAPSATAGQPGAGVPRALSGVGTAYRRLSRATRRRDRRAYRRARTAVRRQESRLRRVLGSL